MSFGRTSLFSNEFINYLQVRKALEESVLSDGINIIFRATMVCIDDVTLHSDKIQNENKKEINKYCLKMDAMFFVAVSKFNLFMSGG